MSEGSFREAYLQGQLDAEKEKSAFFEAELEKAREAYQAVAQECVDWMKQHSMLVTANEVLRYDLAQRQAALGDVAQVCECLECLKLDDPPELAAPSDSE